MGCTNCSNKIYSDNDEVITSSIFGSSTSYDWLNDLPDGAGTSDIVEVRFKSNRKGFFRNTNNLKLNVNDLVAVQVARGFDVGSVSLKGVLAEKQMKRKVQNPELESLGIIYRKATENDMKNWAAGKKSEKAALIKSREMAMSLNLDMKISDVEFQGDNKKATFFYIADNRVDFRELIKILAREFKVNIEMKQIGARQEAGKIGGIGSCGKELCCSTWRTKLPSVSSSSIQSQQLSHNIEKYTGQCGKLKCCLMYELDTYLEAKADFPTELLELETKKGIAFPAKIDILKKTVWYTFKTGAAIETPIEVPLDRVKEIINLNKRGVEVVELVAGEVKHKL
jgi:cell fate regulator YaaT (PSP1 superfamily)